MSQNSSDKPEGAHSLRDEDGRDLKFYGRRKGKALRVERLDAMETVFPAVKLPLPAPDTDPASFFDTPVRAVWFEVGFGSGEHLIHHALQNPDIGMIGCEPFLNGIAALCRDIKQHGIKNIRIFADDARLFMPGLKSGSIERAFVLNSDPWPKTRHAKRRFIQKETLDELHRLLKPGAEFRMSSDHPVLAAWQLEQAYFHGGYEWQAKDASSWRGRPADLPQTRYQKKGEIQGRETVFLNFNRRP